MNGYKLCPSRQFRRRLGPALESGCPLPQLRRVLDGLCRGSLPEDVLDRALSGRGQGCRECAVGGGFSVVYRYRGDRVVLYYIKLPRKPRRSAMFLLTEIRYRLFRARGRTVLLLSAAALLAGSLALYLGNIQANRDALMSLADRVPVTVRVVSRSGSRQDGLFIKTAGELKQNLEVFDSFLLPFFGLIIGMITLVTFLVLRGSRREMAIASSLGRQKSMNAASQFFGAIIAELAGCAVALPVMCLAVDLLPLTAVAVAGVYMACACVGTGIALWFILRFDTLALLTKVD